ncbi:MAG TPA: SDR family oxidoreductase [Candidatus Limiplasma sp.]|nr:SDR family oxidoreductase [Candidatus Limiplasma sp.]HPR77810.1 SDR family oxidoreductase [Candidatus Limiplasma sp.]
MKALFIGGTGTISTAISQLCVQLGWELTLLNRGTHRERMPEGVEQIAADMNDRADVQAKLAGRKFDVVADFIAFTVDQVERDIQLFSGKTAQYFFISSASAYQKPLSSPFITESTPLSNPFWQYSRDKIACEELLMKEYRANGFPITIIRPSHTYGDMGVPVALHGAKGSYAVVDRIRRGLKVIVPGDGLTLWTLTHNTDFAKAFCGLMGNVHAIGETYQITGDESLTWNQIYGAIAAAFGEEPHLVHIATETLARLAPNWSGELIGDKSNTVVFDNAKIKRAVPGFTATLRFDQGVRRTIAYIYSHPELQVPDPAFEEWMDQGIDAYEKLEKTMPYYG